MAEKKEKAERKLLKDTETGRVNFNVFVEDMQKSDILGSKYTELFKKKVNPATLYTDEIRQVVYALLKITSRRVATGGKAKYTKALAKELSTERLKEIAEQENIIIEED